MPLRSGGTGGDAEKADPVRGGARSTDRRLPGSPAPEAPAANGEALPSTVAGAPLSSPARPVDGGHHHPSGPGPVRRHRGYAQPARSNDASPAPEPTPGMVRPGRAGADAGVFPARVQAVPAVPRVGFSR